MRLNKLKSLKVEKSKDDVVCDVVNDGVCKGVGDGVWEGVCEGVYDDVCDGVYGSEGLIRWNNWF